jgi:outer membrane protein assembly factor BamB
MCPRLSVPIAFPVVFALLSSLSGQAAPALKDRDASTPFVEWAIAGDFVSNEPHDPLFVKDLVIVGTDKGELRAYRNSDGKLAWSHEHGKRIYHAPCSDGERVYFSSEVD